MKKCAVRDHGEQGEYGYNCALCCWEQALRQQHIQVRAEQKAEHQKWLASQFPKAA